MRILMLSLFVVLAFVQAYSDEYIIRIAPTASISEFASYNARTVVPSAVLVKQSKMVQTQVQQDALRVMIRYITIDVSNDQQLRLLVSDPRIEAIDKNGILKLHQISVTNDPKSSEQYALTKVGAQAAWQKATGANVVVGVLDTGVDWDHEDLRNQLAARVGEDLNGNGRFEPWDYRQQFDGLYGDLDNIDNDDNGYVDDVIGYDFIDQSVRNIGDDRHRDAIPFDEQGHGTSVAGVIAAQANNELGMAGLAYDARIAVLRAFDATGNAEEDDVAAALIYAALNKISVVNMSFGDAVNSPVLRDAIRFAFAQGCVLVASAGNTGTTSRQFPASYDEVIAVGATNSFDARAAFSSTGSILSITAPGEAIVTTRAGGGYRTVNGTSFSAPYVAAAAALLIQQRGVIGPLQVKTMLMESSTDLGIRGWDGEFGAGRLQADVLLNLPSEGLVDIVSPRNESEFDASSNSNLDVFGSTQAILFDSYNISVGQGAEPNSWMSVLSSDTSILKGRLASITPSILPEGDNVVRLTVVLKDGRSTEIRKRVHVTNSKSLTITDAAAERAWNDDKRVVSLFVVTSRPTTLYAITTTDNSGGPDTTTDINRFTRQHNIAIVPPLSGTRGSIRVLCTADNGDSAEAIVQFDLDTIAVPVTGFDLKAPAPFAGYVLDDVRALYGNNDDTFIMNDISKVSFGAMLSVQLSGSSWLSVDSTSDVWIPRAMGDANGNGITDILGQVVGNTALFEADKVGGNPFAKTIYQEEFTEFNGVDLFDVDADGVDDILMLADSGVKVMSYKNGAFVSIGFARNTSLPAEGNSENRIDEFSVAVGDFDADGNVEIAFSDTDGDLIISQYADGQFTTEYVYEGTGGGGSGYVTSGDIDNDGLPDIVLGVPDSVQPNVQGEYGRQLWTYRLFKSVGANKYDVVWTDYFFGVQYGIGYRNGVGTGQLDMQGGQEIIICAFPRLYVFRWENSSIKPIYYRPDVVSPRFLTHDFDHNGVNELGFGKTEPELGYMTSFQFIEFNADEKRLPTPNGVRAVSTSDTSAYLTWMPVLNATAYRIFITTPSDGLFRGVDTVTVTSFTFDTLHTQNEYSFRVSAIAPGSGVSESFRSAIVTVNAGNPYKPIKIQPSAATLQDFSTGITLTVRFNGPMSEHSIEPTKFIILDSDGNIGAVGSSAELAGDSTIVVSFRPMVINGDSCTLFVGSLYNKRDIPTLPARFAIRIVADTNSAELSLEKLVVINNTAVVLTYSMPVDSSATVLSNYVLKPVGTIASVTPVDDKNVEIRFGAEPSLAALGNLYSITVNNVMSVSGISITKGAGNTLAFVITSDELDNVFAFPHPVRIGTDEYVTFGNLTQQAEIEVLDQRFLTIIRIKEIDGNGGARWDLHDASGKQVPPGMYFYKVTGTDALGSRKDSGLYKLMIVR
ncbi:MAG: S8 family serine peptidase [Ignavibacteria bacterium]|nr:S8 family serine peptidase [Ignavibacteria bacterium]